MTRVASLYLPSWSIDRLRRIERRLGRRPCAPPAEADASAALDGLGADAAAERAGQCSVPREGGWRPGARWARTERPDVEAAIAALPAHRRPPQRELGRVSEAADNPFRAPVEERVAPPAVLREMARRTEAAEPPFRPGTRGWHGVEDLNATIAGMPAHQRPSFQELSRRSEVVDNPFGFSPDEVGPNLRHGRPDMPVLSAAFSGGEGPTLRSGEDAPAKAGRGEALRTARERHRNTAPSIRDLAAMPPVHGPGEDVVVRRAIVVARRALPAGSPTAITKAKAPRRSARDGHGGEAGFIAPPSLAQLAAMPAVQFPGEGPHPGNHGKSEPPNPTGAPTYGQGRFFQTGRTLGSVVARVCREDAPVAVVAEADEPPLVIARKTGARVEIAAANDAAQALGIASGTALTMARAQVPGLTVRDDDPAGDAADLAALATMLARRWAPGVMVSDVDGLFVELTGVAHLHGGEARFARRLVRLLARAGIAARVAVADSAGAAWALARFGSAAAVQVVAPGGDAARLAPLPVAALRLEAGALELLARLGVDTVGALAAMPRAPLVRRFGPAIVRRLDQAAGRVPEPLDPVVPAEAISVEQRFAEPIATPEAIAHWLGALIARLCVALAEAGQGTRALELVAARVDGVPQRLRLGFARPTRDPAHLTRLALRRIEAIEPGYGIDALTLHVRRADPLAPEPYDPALAGAATPDLAPLVDALANRIGLARLWWMEPVESDVPERSVARVSPLDPPPVRAAALRRDDVRRLDGRLPDHPWRPRWSRPVRLLRRPEPVDNVLAEMPDQPPRRFTWRGVAHRVVRAEGPERIAGEWWRRAPERLAVRDYFRVEDEAGERFWLYRRGDGVRLETGDLRWFLHGRGG